MYYINMNNPYIYTTIQNFTVGQFVLHSPRLHLFD